MQSETVEITGHLMDSGILSRILDDIREYDGDYVIDRFDVGHDAHDHLAGSRLQGRKLAGGEDAG